MTRKIDLVILLNVLAFAFFAAAVSADPKQSEPGSRPPAAPLAPVGSAFTYQGRLTTGGSPANGSYDLQFTLYDASSGGNLVGGPLTVLSQTVPNGLFTVPLDFGQNSFS